MKRLGVALCVVALALPLSCEKVLNDPPTSSPTVAVTVPPPPMPPGYPPPPPLPVFPGYTGSFGRVVVGGGAGYCIMGDASSLAPLFASGEVVADPACHPVRMAGGWRLP